MKAEEAQSLVTQGLARITEDPKEWAAWAKTLSRFAKYSPGNALLIMMQRPDASYVAGYRAWQGLGRQVNRGEKAIGILAPVLKADEDSGDRKLVAFRTASVFDITQTSGEPLKIPEPVPLEGSRMGEVLDRLIPVVGHPVQFAETGEAYGIWNPAEGTIAIKADAPPDHQLKTLLHEWSHAIGVPSADAMAERHRGPEEIIAETTAFVVAGSLGLDTSEYSRGYVAGWAQGDLKVVAQATHEIGTRVHAVIGAIEKAAEKDPELKSLTVGWQPIAPPTQEPVIERVAGRAR